MIKTQTCHWVVCDGCGRTDFNDEYTEHHDTEIQAVECLEENDGYIDPITNQHLCWHCRDLPHAARPIGPDSCERCTTPASQHPDKDPEPTT